MTTKATASKLISTLSEGTEQFFVVDYYAVTPKGTRGRFQKQTSLNQINNARSETSVLYYLKNIHKGCEIIIQNLEYK